MRKNNYVIFLKDLVYAENPVSEGSLPVWPLQKVNPFYLGIAFSEMTCDWRSFHQGIPESTQHANCHSHDW